MAFPGAIASFLGFTSSHTLSADQHAAQHNSEQAEIVAAQTKIGTGASTPTSGKLLRGTGVGTSAWAQADLTTDVTGVLPQANGGTGTTLATGTGKTVYDTSPTISGATLSTPTLTVPTIADYTNAAHDHGDADDGGQIVSAAIPADAVNDSQLIFGKLRSRQGGSATNWSTAGTTTFDYSATNTFCQTGAVAVSSDNFVINFPTAFNQVPNVIAIVSTAASVNGFPVVISRTATTVTVRVMNGAGAVATSETITWFAWGE
jgi:hypothetical protein